MFYSLRAFPAISRMARNVRNKILLTLKMTMLEIITIIYIKFVLGTLTLYIIELKAFVVVILQSIIVLL